MKKRGILLGLVVMSLSCFGQLKTPFEKSGGKATGTYQEVISFYQELALKFPEVIIEEIGMTDSGYPLHLVTVSFDKNFDYTKSKEKTVILINNGIHPGEPDGIEASMMLVRDFISDSKKKKALENVTLAIIPIYNIGGALNRNSYSRTNQDGPIEYGFRGNAKNLDLNRDFIKMDSKNAQSFAQIFHKVTPDILIDTHVSNGADYQYTNTHIATQPDKLGGELGTYLREEMIPQLEEGMKNKGDEIIPFVNIYNKPPDVEGYTQFMDSPRYATGYTALFHTIGFTIETHMLKPFNVRVPSTYRFIETIIDIAQKDGTKIKKMRTDKLMTSVVGNTMPVDWELDKSKSRTLSFKGYEGSYKKSEVTGFDRLYYDREKPFTKEIPYYNVYQPTHSISAPNAYVIPQAWNEVIERLKLNNIILKPFDKDTAMSVQFYRIEDYNTSKSAYEDHYPHNSVTVSTHEATMKFRKGDYWISLDQPAGRFLVEVLEPQAKDSYFNWNFFDTILQQKEYFSPYVFEEIAAKLLGDNKDLKEDFEEKKAMEEEFAKSWYMQLTYLYRNSPHYESAHLRYPVFRVINK